MAKEIEAEVEEESKELENKAVMEEQRGKEKWEKGQR